MSLWQNTRWTQRQNQSTLTSLTNPRTSLSGNSSAATSTISLVSSNSSSVPPRRPLNQLNLHQDRRSNSITRSKLVEPSKSDHDPVKTLIGILGELPDTERVAQEPIERKEEEKKKEAVGKKLEKVDAAGKTLAAWLEELEKDKLAKLSKDIEQQTTALRQYEELQSSITTCDNVLKEVETFLSAFQTDLGSVSAEIEFLQARSVSLSTKATNRKQVETHLGPIVDDIVLSPTIIQRISEGEINDAWVKTLIEFDSKFAPLYELEKRGIKAVEDVKPQFELLRTRALIRIRDFLVERIRSLRVPNSNIQVIQQTTMLRYRALFHFMLEHHPQLANEIKRAYMNTMKWYYSYHFDRFKRVLEKVKVETKVEMLGTDDRKGGLFSTGRSGSLPVNDPFHLGDRVDILKGDLDLVSMQAKDLDRPYLPEVLFRNYNQTLIDNASSEYFFLTDFLGTSKSHDIVAVFSYIFEPTMAISSAFTKHIAASTSDIYGILLCIRLTQHFAFTLQKRRMPALDGYINSTNMLLWPRFQVLMDQHAESLRRFGVPTGSRGRDETLSPHAITQRFAGLMQGLLQLSQEERDDEPLVNSLGRVRSDFEAFLTKWSASIGDGRKRERFLYNNYNLVSAVLASVDGKVTEREKEHFNNLVKAFEASA